MTAVTHVANVAWPAPGKCFRMVYGNGRNGYPDRCPSEVRWHGVWVNPKGERWPVDACDEHVEDVEEVAPKDCLSGAASSESPALSPAAGRVQVPAVGQRSD